MDIRRTFRRLGTKLLWTLTGRVEVCKEEKQTSLVLGD